MIAIEKGLPDEDLSSVLRHLQPVSGLLLLAHENLEVSVLVQLKFRVVEMAGSSRDLVSSGEVLVLGRETQIVDGLTLAADPVVEIRVDRSTDIVVVGIVQPHSDTIGHGAEDRIFRPWILHEGEEPGSEESTEVSQPLSPVEDRGLEIFSQQHVTGFLEQVAEFRPGLGILDFFDGA